ncbi:MAG TPA: UDP-forming cellulose synthase catalytic subunit [Methylophilus sp.]
MSSDRFGLFIWGMMTVMLFLLSSISTSHEAQTIISTVLITALILLYRISKTYIHKSGRHLIRMAIIVISTFLTFRYINWRATESLPMQFGLVSMVCGLLLFLAESYGLINSLMGFFINAHPYHRQPIPLPKDDSLLPHVDIYIPTYNEDASITRPTVIAATQIHYPREKLHVYILDDGGTTQKLNDPDPIKAQAAAVRSAELKALAARYGAGYITREKNQSAKAGNINNALQHTSGDLLLILDCDHIPTEDFLQNTVGLFLADPQLFVVQTPHNFVSPDPLEKNLDTYTSSPAENELFYDVMQPGLDTWGTSFFCGSAAVLRRSVINQLGGVAGSTITEDAETTLDALSLGYSTAYLNKPMVSGLQPETYSGFVIQRVRWAQGMLQIFILKNPWRQPKLNIFQRLLYTNFAFYWGFASARMVMLVAPPVFLIFSINLCDASAQDLVSYAAPSLIASLITTQYFYGRVRWPFMSQLYEVIQSIYVTVGLIQVARNPRSPAFKVTPKGEVLSKKFISSLTMPFYFFLVFNLMGLIWGVHRYTTQTSGQGVLAFVMFWAVLDLALLLSALGVMLEKKQLRQEPRVPHQEPVSLVRNNAETLTGMSINASTTGARITVPFDTVRSGQLAKGEVVTVHFHDSLAVLNAQVIVHRRATGQQLELGLLYQLSTVNEERNAIRVAFGSSQQISINNQVRHQGRSIITGFLNIIRYAVRYGSEHLRFLLKTFTTNLIIFIRQQKGR